MGTPSRLDEIQRQLTICNACRYCEGYCAVFPALERHRTFDATTVEYLAHLCHDCRDCLYNCQYAPPHPFAVNIPQVLAQVRMESFRAHAWPPALAQWVEAIPWAAVRVTLGAVVVALAAVWALAGPGRLFAAHHGPGAFYAVVPLAVLLTAFTLLGLFWLGAWVVEGVRYWRAMGGGGASPVTLRSLLRALADAAHQRYLGGGGAGCANGPEDASTRRRWLHHAVMYGFLCDLAATTLAAIDQHLWHQVAPYPLTSPVVILGTLGGIGILLGGVGLLWFKLSSDPQALPPEGRAGDLAFLTALILVAATGLALLAARDTVAMGSLFGIHLGCVAAFFVTAPYNKFRHAVYRYLALVRYHAERNGPTQASAQGRTRLAEGLPRQSQGLGG